MLPLAGFLVLAVIFGFALWGGDPSKLPSALIGRPAPQFTLPPVEELSGSGGAIAGFATADLARGEPTIVNVWASWCGPCHEEHPVLVALAGKAGVPLYGINYKDDPAEARRFLGRYGNPFARVGADRSGRVSVDWGVYGVPETFIVDGRGRIAYKHVGPLTEEAVAQKILPAIERAKAAK
jgi:cytochrome c biogenesis protein CcmG/thiol:disulfide interchange protein DsbE